MIAARRYGNRSSQPIGQSGPGEIVRSIREEEPVIFLALRFSHLLRISHSAFRIYDGVARGTGTRFGPG